MKIRLFLASLLCALLPAVIAEAQVTELSPAFKRLLSAGNGDDPGDLLWVMDVEGITGDTRCLGVEYDGTDLWITGALDQLTCQLYRIDMSGTLLNSYPTGKTGWGWRDLCWDGTYLYASDSAQIEQIDPATGMVTGMTIPSPINPARALAYDAGTNSFWTCSWSSSIYNIQWNGTYYSYPNTLGSVYGMAMDESDPANPMLWIWDQGGPTGCQAYQFDPRNGIFTGLHFEGDATIGGISGGCAIYEDPVNESVFIGLHQASPDTIAGYWLEDGGPPEVDLKVNGKDGIVMIPSTQNCVIDFYVEAKDALGYNLDVLVVIKRQPYLYYHNNGSNWVPGVGGSYYTGPLMDIPTTRVLDQPIPLGNYTAYLAIDSVPNGAPDAANLVALDQVEIQIY